MPENCIISTPEDLKNKNIKIVLASESPRRKALLARIGLKEPYIEIRASHAEEYAPPGLNPREIVEKISREKAEAVSAAPDEMIIAADTMVFLDNLKLGKPENCDDALNMLLKLQGRRHTVRTGVTIRRDNIYLTDSEQTDVIFRQASRDELTRYIATGEPLDKAGAYGIQGRGALLVERIDGDYTNVIGLPLPLLSRMLARFGVILL